MTAYNLDAIPLYLGHKKVRALKIKSVTHVKFDTTTDENEIVEIEFEDGTFPSDRVNLRGKPTPEAGWYMVFYEDGYTSFSPTKTFEEGYTRLHPSEPDTAFKVGPISVLFKRGAINPDSTLGHVKIYDEDGAAVYITFEQAKTIAKEMTSRCDYWSK